MSVSFLKRDGAPALACRADLGRDPNRSTVVFLTGFASDMEGTKASFLAQACAAKNRNSVRFDYRGHGASEGRFEDGTIGLWKQDALDVIDSLPEGDVLLVGSSMGGWIALLCALERAPRISGLVGLAAAPDFTRAIPGEMNEPQRHELEQNGYFSLPADFGDRPYCITKALLEDGEKHILLDAPIPLSCPVRLIQGMKDREVSWQTAHRIANAVTGMDKKVYLREDGDHRLSAPGDLALLEQLVFEIP